MHVFVAGLKISEFEVVESNPLQLGFYLAYFGKQNSIDYIGP